MKIHGMDKWNEWLPYLKMDVLSLAFIYARYTMNMDSLTGFRNEKLFKSTFLGWKYYNSKRTKEQKKMNLYTLIMINI